MMENSPVKRFPVNAKDYKLYEEVGEGVSATVYRALCIPLNEHVAIKVLDLERCNNDLDGIRREVQTMSLTEHPNVVRSHCSFTTDRSLWVVMPYMAGGSCLQIMKSDFPEGLEQPIIATLLREVLKALVYLHAHGHIHRDVKAGNILIDSMGAVKLADFGVSACMFDTGDRQRSRNTFVGTPCWMAPEVMQQLHGYDFKADIWSFGITALELAHGHAPFSKYPPMKVLLMTLQNAPPGLDYERDKKFSKSFKEIVAACLVKDPKKRPTSEKLLKHPFFKHARSSDFIARYILEGLSPLGDRFRMLKEKEANILLQNQALHGDKDHLSQQEYMRGISAWNFNLEDLKKQAALIEDDDSVTKREDSDFLNKQDACENLVSSEDKLLVESLCNSISVPLQEDRQGNLQNIQNLKISYPFDSPKELEGCIQNGMNGTTECSTKEIHTGSVPEPPMLLMKVEDKRPKNLGEDVCEEPSFLSKGRFKVAMADSRVKESAHGSVSTLVGKSVGDPSTRDTLLLPSLRCILQQNSMQREQIQRLLKYADQSIGNYREFSNLGIINEHLQAPEVSARERDLQSQITDMRRSIEKLDEELHKLKTKNGQLEKQISGLQNK